MPFQWDIFGRWPSTARPAARPVISWPIYLQGDGDEVAPINSPRNPSPCPPTPPQSRCEEDGFPARLEKSRIFHHQISASAIKVIPCTYARPETLRWADCRSTQNLNGVIAARDSVTKRAPWLRDRSTFSPRSPPRLPSFEFESLGDMMESVGSSFTSRRGSSSDTTRRDSFDIMYVCNNDGEASGGESEVTEYESPSYSSAGSPESSGSSREIRYCAFPKGCGHDRLPGLNRQGHLFYPNTSHAGAVTVLRSRARLRSRRPRKMSSKAPLHLDSTLTNQTDGFLDPPNIKPPPPAHFGLLKCSRHVGPGEDTAEEIGKGRAMVLHRGKPRQVNITSAPPANRRYQRQSQQPFTSVDDTDNVNKPSHSRRRYQQNLTLSSPTSERHARYSDEKDSPDSTPQTTPAISVNKQQAVAQVTRLKSGEGSQIHKTRRQAYLEYVRDFRHKPTSLRSCILAG